MYFNIYLGKSADWGVSLRLNILVSPLTGCCLCRSDISGAYLFHRLSPQTSPWHYSDGSSRRHARSPNSVYASCSAPVRFCIERTRTQGMALYHICGTADQCCGSARRTMDVGPCLLPIYPLFVTLTNRFDQGHRVRSAFCSSTLSSSVRFH